MNDIEVGQIINDRYRLIQYVGSGSFGEVWMGYDEEKGENVAVKIYLSLDAKGREEFETEYKIALGLNHPCLLTAQVYETWGTRPYLIMKYCSMGSVTKAVGNLRPIEIDEFFVWQFIHDVAAGLAYLHNQSPDPVVHQDIKPDNILVDSDYHCLITDFGISKRIRSTLRSQSSRALKAGATAYMGPERFVKKPAPVTASDIWSMGASIFELTEGELPFAGMGGVLQKNGAEMAELSVGWTEELNQLMQRCLAPETWDRPRAQEIEEYAAGILNNFHQWYAKAPKVGVEVDPRRTQRRTTDFEPSDNPFALGMKERLEGSSCKGSDVKKDILKRSNSLEKKENKHITSNSSLQVTPSSNQLKNNISDSDSKRNHGVLYGALAVIVVALALAGGAFYLFYDKEPSPDEMAQIVYDKEYAMLVNNCQDSIKYGSQANYSTLIAADRMLISIDSLERIYQSALPEKFCKTAELREALDEKVKPASDAWVEAARVQVKELENMERAVEYYDIALSLQENSTIRKERDVIASKTQDTINKRQEGLQEGRKEKKTPLPSKLDAELPGEKKQTSLPSVKEKLDAELPGESLIE